MTHSFFLRAYFIFLSGPFHWLLISWRIQVLMDIHRVVHTSREPRFESGLLGSGSLEPELLALVVCHGSVVFFFLLPLGHFFSLGLINVSRCMKKKKGMKW